MKINRFTPDLSIFKQTEPKKQNNINDINFKDALKKGLDFVNNKQIKSDEITKNFIEGKETDVHNVMIAEAEAKMSLDMAIEVRNKLVEAYQDLNRMQI